MNTRHLFVGAFVVTVGSLFWYDWKKCHDLPWPPRLIMAGVTFGLLDVFSMFNEELSGVIAIGLVLAVLVNKGFVPDNCSHQGCTTQPASFKSLSNSPNVQTV